ncbi:ribosome-associated translation inhibitor RaiA [candidate division WOR-3 bacterium]|nr:ribosome-associated translation inhibitor RaiA [candidate division WOR-3 bacterium]
MEVSITSRHFKLSGKLKMKIRDEFEKFSRYTDRIIGADVILEENGNRKSVEIKMKVDKSLITAKGEDYDLTKAIEISISKMENRIKKHVGKYHRRRKG